MRKESTTLGIGMGTALAMSMSWGLHHSVLLAILHGICSWFYVIVWVLS